MLGGADRRPGGFVDITQSAQKVVFCGTFDAKGTRLEIAEDGRLTIRRHGEVAKLVEKVRRHHLQRRRCPDGAGRRCST